MALTWPPKDPDEVLDYVMNWLGSSNEPGPLLLANDTISTSTWTIPSGITKNSDSHTATTTTVWLSGGMLGATYEMNNRIVTVGGRTMDQSVRIKIRAK